MQFIFVIQIFDIQVRKRIVSMQIVFGVLMVKIKKGYVVMKIQVLILGMIKEILVFVKGY